MRGRIRKLAPSTRNPVGWRNGGQSRAPKEQPLALDGTSVPKVRVASAVESVDVSELIPILSKSDSLGIPKSAAK
jgi:hypothetical protein